MKTLIVGSRSIVDYEILLYAISKWPQPITHIVSGGAKGIDSLAAFYAKQNNIPLTVVYPDWDRYGKSAGYLRNKDMVENYDVEALIAITNGSKGTGHTINLAKAAGLQYKIFNYPNDFVDAINEINRP